MIVDINAYVGKWPYWRIDESTPEDILRVMDRWKIDRAVICSLKGVFVDWRGGNDEVLAAVKKWDDRFVGAAILGPFGSNPREDVKRCKELGFKAIRLFPALHNYPLTHRFFDDACEEARRNGMPVMISARPTMHWRFPLLNLAGVAQAVSRHKETSFILSGINRNEEFDAAVEMINNHPSFFCEISAMQGFQETAKAVRSVGSKKILFGSATPLQYTACAVEKMGHAWVNEDERNDIVWNNSAALLGLSG